MKSYKAPFLPEKAQVQQRTGLGDSMKAHLNTVTWSYRVVEIARDELVIEDGEEVDSPARPQSLKPSRPVFVCVRSKALWSWATSTCSHGFLPILLVYAEENST